MTDSQFEKPIHNQHSFQHTTQKLYLIDYLGQVLQCRYHGRFGLRG